MKMTQNLKKMKNQSLSLKKSVKFTKLLQQKTQNNILFKNNKTKKNTNIED